MTHTGRITSTLHPDAAGIVFNAELSGAIRTEIQHYIEIDRAQAAMLMHVGLLRHSVAKRILLELDRLEQTDFQHLARLPAPRGTYLAYEDHLRDVIGAEAGNLHLGRSRNDINATVFKLRLREPYVGLVQETVAIVRALCLKARAHLETIIPLHTHRQPALPSTVAHHFAAFASALVRDLEALDALQNDLENSCLGAAVGGGSTLPIQPEMTARLLGFERPPQNSIDAVASRDLALRCLSAAAILTSNLGRIAETLLMWGGDAGIARLPDDLVGSSSAMPHKRNPFLLELVQGKAGTVTGALVAAISGMHAAPFTNCAAVGTEAASHVWTGLQEATNAVRLVRLCISGVEFDTVRGAALVDDTFTNAMEAATLLARHQDADFRSAHNAIGSAVTRAIASGQKALVAGVCRAHAARLHEHENELHSETIIKAARSGGGPEPSAVLQQLDRISMRTRKVSDDQLALRSRWRHCRTDLRAAVDTIIADKHHTRSHCLVEEGAI